MLDGLHNSFIKFTFNQLAHGLVKGFKNGWPQKKLPLTNFRQTRDDDESTEYDATVKFEDEVTFIGDSSLDLKFTVPKGKESVVKVKLDYFGDLTLTPISYDEFTFDKCEQKRDASGYTLMWLSNANSMTQLDS